MAYHPERDEVPDRIRKIILGRVPDEEGELSEWLADCSEAQFEAYLELSGAVLEEALEGEVRDEEDEDDELY